ncbi:ABC transporter permease [Pseudonocardia sp. TRM90224]|uniref:ABC transporter permease n=1 Tax=Pseudonocardia sp. TRM90224 TaxID=2812678 RepID=UPI001E4B0917|nr:ABC transporter permease [Pseudonocardia sp. TRM90224]
MNIFESARIAMRGLRANKLRSGLTTLGIVIGVSSVIILTSLGNGVQSNFNEQFGSLANVITVSQLQGAVPGGGTAKPITDADVEALKNRSRAPDVLSVTPAVNGNVLVQVPGNDPYSTSVNGTTEDYLDVNNRELLAGSMFDESQVRLKAKVVVLGPTVIARVFNGDAAGAIGKEVRIGRTTFRVLGVLKGNGQEDDTVVMPLGAARSYLLGGGDDVNVLTIRATSVATVDAAVEQINNVLSARHNIRDPDKRDFRAQAFGSLLDQANSFLSVLTLFTVAVAGISLVVGSIGVANIMLVTVTERTREIGIRKAIGARRKSILQQFLLESMFLSGVGGLIGIAFGVGVTLLGRWLLPQVAPDFPVPAVDFGAVIVSFTISLLIGLIAGGYPANRASKLRPIEALRYQ